VRWLLVFAGVWVGFGCAGFRRLAEDLRFEERTTILTGRVENAADYAGHRVHAAVFQRDPVTGEILRADTTEVEGFGIFGFFVEDPSDQCMAAYADTNDNDRYDRGEPAWVSRDREGRIAPVEYRPDGPEAIARLSRTERGSAALERAREAFMKGRSRDEVRVGWDLPIALGEVVDLDDPRFSSERAASGYWEPASYPRETGLGIYFLQKYDPGRTPVLFVHGAAGSPHDFEAMIGALDRRRFQPWVYHYPSGRDLGEMAGALDAGLRLLHRHFGFERVHLVAHSMGGLVARRAILDHRRGGERFIDRYVSISTPYGGQEFAATGVRRAPAVIPSWRDIEPESEFVGELFESDLSGRVDHLLIYGDRGRRRIGLPRENDGTVSVRSMTREEAVADADEVRRFDEDHVSILANPEVLAAVEGYLR